MGLYRKDGAASRYFAHAQGLCPLQIDKRKVLVRMEKEVVRK